MKHNVNLVVLTLLEAIALNSVPTIIHSDQGSEYRHMLTPDQIVEEQVQEVELALMALRRWGFPASLFFNRSGQYQSVASEIYIFMKKIVE